mmetsp:Transcript_39864/g.89450  ORF Transcript_39864/g.89450 Transcript_39864/m.89450 type:complete len:286 (+) Transcript_39864:8-865(+)
MAQVPVCSAMSTPHPDHVQQRWQVVQLGSHVLVKDRPCRVVELSFSKAGKCGHPKARVVGRDVFDGKKIEAIFRQSVLPQMVKVSRCKYVVLDLSTPILSLLTPEGTTKDDVNLPSWPEAKATAADLERASQIETWLQNGTAVEVAVLSASDEEKVVGAWDADGEFGAEGSRADEVEAWLSGARFLAPLGVCGASGDVAQAEAGSVPAVVGLLATFPAPLSQEGAAVAVSLTQKAPATPQGEAQAAHDISSMAQPEQLGGSTLGDKTGQQAAQMFSAFDGEWVVL